MGVVLSLLARKVLAMTGPPLRASSDGLSGPAELGVVNPDTVPDHGRPAC